MMERDHWRGVDGRMTLRRVFRELVVGVWTGLSFLRIQEKDWWRALVNAVMNFRVP
jgi:hypothetical protein